MVNNIVTVKEEIFKNSTTVECKLPVSLVDGESVINLTANSEINSVYVKLFPFFIHRTQEFCKVISLNGGNLRVLFF